MTRRFLVAVVFGLSMGIGHGALACDTTNPESVAASFSKAVLDDEFHAAIACLHPHERAILFLVLLTRAGQEAGVFFGEGGQVTDYDLESETEVGQAFLALVAEHEIGLGKYQDDPLGEEASDEQLLERFLDIAGPDTNASIFALDRFLEERFDIAFGPTFMPMLVHQPVTRIQGGGPTMRAFMGHQEIQITEYQGDWYIAKAWALTLSR